MSCITGKRRLPTEGAAKIAIWQAAISRSPKRRENRYYQCQRCKGWHLTSAPLVGKR